MKDCAIFNLILHNVLFAFSYSLVYNYLYNYVCHYKGDLISMSLPIPKQASADSACFSDNLTDIGICVFDQNGKFLYMNDSFLKTAMSLVHFMSPVLPSIFSTTT